MEDKYPRQMPGMPEGDESEGDEMAEGGPKIDIPVEEIAGSENWKDGETYEISMTVKQVSMGKFEILEAEEETPEEESGAEDMGETE